MPKKKETVIRSYDQMEYVAQMRAFFQLETFTVLVLLRDNANIIPGPDKQYFQVPKGRRYSLSACLLGI